MGHLLLICILISLCLNMTSARNAPLSCACTFWVRHVSYMLFEHRTHLGLGKMSEMLHSPPVPDGPHYQKHKGQVVRLRRQNVLPDHFRYRRQQFRAVHQQWPRLHLGIQGPSNSRGAVQGSVVQVVHWSPAVPTETLCSTRCAVRINGQGSLLDGTGNIIGRSFPISPYSSKPTVSHFSRSPSSHFPPASSHSSKLIEF